MKTIKLDKQQATFLTKLLPEKKFSEGMNHIANKEEIEHTIDLLSNLLIEEGVDEQGEVNKYGVFIDDLIGVFNSLLLESIGHYDVDVLYE